MFTHLKLHVIFYFLNTAKKKRNIQPLSEVAYITIKDLLLGKFKVKVKDRTRAHRNAVRQYQRHGKYFAVSEGDLTYRGRKVTTQGQAKGIVKEIYDAKKGCGVRALSHIAKEKYAGINEALVAEQLSISSKNKETYPKFNNKNIPKSIIANEVSERWQIDLIDKSREKVRYKGRSCGYILTVVSVVIC